MLRRGPTPISAEHVQNTCLLLVWSQAVPPPMHRSGHWLRQKDCSFLQSCADCRSTQTLRGALRKQREAAGSTAVQPRRLVLSINGDMKRLMQIAGMASQGVYNCLFCSHQKNATSVAGIPCLRHPTAGGGLRRTSLGLRRCAIRWHELARTTWH